MPSEFVSAVTRYNMCTWYILPLIYLNKASFGEGNFVESFVNQSGSTLTVEVIMLDICHKDCLESPHLMRKLDRPKEHAFLWYYVPSRWRADFDLFKAGKYSKLSSAAKHRISEYSGLFSGQYADGYQASDARLQALDRSPQLRKAWEEELDLLPLSVELELMPIPGPRTYREFVEG